MGVNTLGAGFTKAQFNSNILLRIIPNPIADEIAVFVNNWLFGT